jgi:outer membrane protein assembly factor BamB
MRSREQFRLVLRRGPIDRAPHPLARDEQVRGRDQSGSYAGWFIFFALIALFSACDSALNPAPSIPYKTPTPVMAGGEPVLPYSQIVFHDAPLPGQADLQFNSSTWTLSGHDGASTRSIVLPSCCSTATPTPLWYHLVGTPLLDSPVVGYGHIYVVAADGYLHVLNMQTGEEQWRVAVGGEQTSNGIALAHGMIYVAREGHFIAALDANNGQERWRFDTVGVVRAAPLVVGRILLVASGPNSLWCVDALTGEKYWAFHSEDALEQFWPTRTTPDVANGKVYVALGASTEFNALNLRTGRKVWEYALHERMTGGPVLDEARGLVYVVTWSGRVVALDARVGRVRWETRLPAGSESSPALSQQLNMLYLGSFDGSMYALDADSGQIRWHMSAGSAVTASPVIVQTTAQDWLVVATSGGSCLVLDARMGSQLHAWSLGELRAAPIVAQGVLYQASLGDQGLFAFTL